MSLHNFVTIIASPRPRVGKTLLARMLADFYLHNGRTVVAFDLNADEPALTQFLPAHSTVAEISDTHGQMALFDRLVAADGAYKVVDLGHKAFRSFFKVAGEIGFAEEARRRSIAPIILFFSSPDATSVEAYADLRRLFPQAALVPVHNEILGSGQHRDKFPVPSAGSVLIHLPVLAPGLRKIIERRPFSFVDSGGAAPNDIPLDAHIELQRWLRRVFLEFREMELRVLMVDLQSSLQAQT
jgi:hypothetical protein